MDLADLLFIDVEASGLAPDSYPIEVGWADIEGRTGAVLIKPADAWTYWDEEAERLHCISRVRLAEKGMAVDAAAILAATVFAGRTLISDSPGYDERWLAKLFDEANLPIPKLTHAQSLIQGIASDLKRTQLDWILAVEQANSLVPAIHRAVPDALNLATAIRLFAGNRFKNSTL